MDGRSLGRSRKVQSTSAQYGTNGGGLLFSFVMINERKNDRLFLSESSRIHRDNIQNVEFHGYCCLVCLSFIVLPFVVGEVLRSLKFRILFTCPSIVTTVLGDGTQLRTGKTKEVRGLIICFVHNSVLITILYYSTTIEN